MDFDPYSSHWSESVPPMTLIEACWQMTSARGHVLTCGVFQTIAGLEVRCGVLRRPDSLAIRARTRSAREIAADWKTAALEKGYSEVKN